MKFIYRLTLLILFATHFSSKACTPLNPPTVMSQTIINQVLILDFQATSIWVNQCPNIIEVEIACDAAVFGGAANATYSSSAYNTISNPMTVPTMSINLANFCPGPYKWRARESSNSIFGTQSQWTSNGTFTVPGVYVPPTLSVTAALPNICPPQSNTLSAIIGNGCGGSSNTYQWIPTTGLSCPTCSTTLASPGTTTTYTVMVTGGQIGCWTQTAAITVVIAPVQAVFGPIGAMPSSICAGESTTLSMSYYNTGLITWQTATNVNGPWTSIPNTNNFSYASGPLTANTYFRAEVIGCQTIDYTNVVFVNVSPNPTVSAVSTTICPGQTSLLTGVGATNFFWSPPAYPTGALTGAAGPTITTNYTVTGNLAGCTGTTIVTVTVNPAPIIGVTNPTACTNGTINLSSIGGVSYLWYGPGNYTSSIQSPTRTNAVPAMGGAYTVMATSPIGCTAVAVSNVVVASIPNPQITNNNPVCLNSSLNLFGSNVFGYTWTGPNNFSSGVQNPVINNVTQAAAGVYTLIGTVGTCTGITTKSITISPIPSPSITTNSPVCVNKPIFLSGSGGTSYSWAGPPAFTSTLQNAAVLSASLTNSGVFTLTVNSANNCTNSVTATVVVNPLPVIPVANLTVCMTSTINLTSGGGSTYLWSGPSSFSSVFQNPSITNAAANMSGAYNTTVTTALGCSNTAVTTVTVLNLPTANISTPTPSLCTGDNLVLNGLGGTSYSWAGPNNFTSIQQNISINNVPPAATGVYSLSVTLGFCTGTTTRTITVFSLPSPTIITNAPVCEFQILKLHAISSPGSKYEWFGPDNFYQPDSLYIFNSVNLSANGSYTINTLDKNNCRSSNLVPVVVHPVPIVETVNVAACEGQQAVLLSNGGVGYNWTGPANYVSSAANATVPVVNGSTAGTYSLIVSSVHSCTTFATAVVSVKALPQPSLSVTPKACINTSVSLLGLGGDIYRWEGPYDFVSTQQNTTFTATSLSSSGIYTLSVLNSGGCVSYTTAEIEIYTLPDGELISDNQQRCIPFCSNFNLLNPNSAPVLDYNWSVNGRKFNQPVFNYCFNEPGQYVIRGAFKDANGCSNATSYTIDAFPLPVADFVYAPLKPIEMLDDVKFSDMSGGENNTGWNWYFINNQGFKTEERSTNYIFDNAGDYRVAMVVTNKWGCADTMVKKVTVDPDFSIYVPNVFTPNEDGRNEVFQPKGRGVVKYDLRIYDRWGERVFQTNDFPTAWDGTFNGKSCKSDVYAWEIIASDAYGKVKEMSGHVTLYR